ncbi:hypothetical protein MPL1032_190164 [Mesorhizobium plurifarium]|uniref:Uncharacterized protein n=1 Tax=Mesorhizobium plurifarium TaxID=69974 RepID=A0A0K2VUZ5_MESPL|nr:hypothetical protein MPL1032_190164 [Mesorhizobium plurifarium]
MQAGRAWCHDDPGACELMRETIRPDIDWRRKVAIRFRHENYFTVGRCPGRYSVFPR